MALESRRRVPIVLDRVEEKFDQGNMSDALWKELNETIARESQNLRASSTSPKRSDGAEGAGEPSAHQPSAPAISTRPASSKATRSLGRATAIRAVAQALDYLGVGLSRHVGLSLLVAAAATETAAPLFSSGDLLQRMTAPPDSQSSGAVGHDALRLLQSEKIDAEFEQMREQLRAHDGAARAQYESVPTLAVDVAERKAAALRERERRMEERRRRLDELREMEEGAIDHLEAALRVRQKTRESLSEEQRKLLGDVVPPVTTSLIVEGPRPSSGFSPAAKQQPTITPPHPEPGPASASTAPPVEAVEAAAHPPAEATPHSTDPPLSTVDAEL
jgi:hypothetical protein